MVEPERNEKGEKITEDEPNLEHELRKSVKVHEEKEERISKAEDAVAKKEEAEKVKVAEERNHETVEDETLHELKKEAAAEAAWLKHPNGIYTPPIDTSPLPTIGPLAEAAAPTQLYDAASLMG